LQRCAARAGVVHLAQYLKFKNDPQANTAAKLLDLDHFGVFVFEDFCQKQGKFLKVRHRRSGIKVHGAKCLAMGMTKQYTRPLLLARSCGRTCGHDLPMMMSYATLSSSVRRRWHDPMHQVDIPDEIIATKAFAIEGNSSETTAVAKGKRIVDPILGWFEKVGVGIDAEPLEKYGFTLPLHNDEIPERLNSRGTKGQGQTVTLAAPLLSTPTSAGSAAASSKAAVVAEPTGPPAGWWCRSSRMISRVRLGRLVDVVVFCSTYQSWHHVSIFGLRKAVVL